MSYKMISSFASLLFFLFLCRGIALSEQIIVPSPKQSNFEDNDIKVGSNSRLIMPVYFRYRFESAVLEIENYLKSLDSQENTIDVVVKILPNRQTKALRYYEGYTIKISSREIVITGKDYLGALHGLTFFEALVRENEGKIKKGKIADWPDMKVRALHLVIIKGLRPEAMKEQIKLARFGHYNTLIIFIKDNVRFNTMEQLASADAWTKEEFLDVVRFARENGLDVIPEIKLLTHQNKLLKIFYPHLMYNQATYDPQNKDTYDTILPMIDEVIDLINPKAFHIGHDELAGLSPVSSKKWLRKGEVPLPRHLFLADVQYLHKHLKNRGIKTWMWGDMLIAPKEFPTMLARHLHGIKGYSSLRGKIPRDIVICDWHYFDEQSDFPSALSFVKTGHKVLGATWKKEKTIRNFSRYIINMSPNAEGMIATTWLASLRGDFNALKKIIQTSANTFWDTKHRRQL
ncbi:MAG: beta-hexosaminidase precursor [Candidatus Jettenia ecosi]|uniref:beta-N-acetylhexosaminidase n=1 Tax=Candidatus Jettenia ecosi TaxID=2494326 RepID=A0A533QCE2_9BACT|nr:MAG: beta-hexosaminidase precursor [Candidatus Jettenia ecosi]